MVHVQPAKSAKSAAAKKGKGAAASAKSKGAAVGAKKAKAKAKVEVEPVAAATAEPAAAAAAGDGDGGVEFGGLMADATAPIAGGLPGGEPSSPPTQFGLGTRRTGVDGSLWEVDLVSGLQVWVPAEGATSGGGRRGSRG